MKKTYLNILTMNKIFINLCLNIYGKLKFLSLKLMKIKKIYKEQMVQIEKKQTDFVNIQNKIKNNRNHMKNKLLNNKN